MRKRLNLNGEWQIKDFIGEDWRWRNSHKHDTKDIRWWRQGTVPGSIHNDLLALGEIPDPFYEINSLLVEWIPERTWVYRKSFFVPSEFKGENVTLNFKGIDYEGEFYLNDVLLGEHKSMFTPASFDVTDILKYDEENLVAVVLKKAPDEQPQVSKTSYVKTHKSRMTYWWDFCPRMIHIGIWDDVYLESKGCSQIDDVFVQPTLKDNYTNADLNIHIKLTSKAAKKLKVVTSIYFENNLIQTDSHSIEMPDDEYTNIYKMNVKNPHLWYPNGNGNQAMYRAIVQVYEEGIASDEREVDFGIREVKFIGNEHTDLPYSLEVNGKRVYIKGWNWVPIDAMYGASKEEKYNRLLTLAENANVNMLRVWGGGLIEKDIFYELCDKKGIMIWQEFIQSSSGIENKPSEDKEFLDLMKNEAEKIIPLKRNHPALVMWCGGNELSFRDIPLDNNEPVLRILKEAVNELDPNRHWQATSPQGPVFLNTLENNRNRPDELHDVHGPWEHQGLKAHYTLYNEGKSLLSSEFGVEGMTNLNTLEKFIDPKNIWPPNKENKVYFHRGSWWNNYNLVQRSFGNKIDKIENMIKASQFMQAEGLRYAVESNRRRKYKNGGSLPWQFNEPFPNNYCTSALDYYTQPKGAYYSVGRAYQPISLTASFEGQSLAGHDTFDVKIWISNSTMISEEAVVNISVYGADGKLYGSGIAAGKMNENSSNEIGRFSMDLNEIEDEIFLLDLNAECNRKKIESRYIFTKSDNLAAVLTKKATLEVNVNEKKSEVSLVNTGNNTAIGIRLEDGRELGNDGYMYTNINDNYFYLLPNERKTVKINWDQVEVKNRRLLINALNVDSIKFE